MEGTNTYRVGLALSHMVMRPKDAGRWFIDAVVSRRTALQRGLPWMSWRAIDFLQTQIKPGLRVFEWGGGGSTVFFAERGCHVTTVESSEAWKAVILERYRDIGGGSLDIRLIPAESQDPGMVARYIRSVHDGAPWDIIVADGLEESYISRMDCIREAADSIAEGGMLILDDAYRSVYSTVPELLKGWERLVFRGLGSARLGVTQTDIYISPRQGPQSILEKTPNA